MSIRVYIEAGGEEDMQQAILQLGFDMESEVKEAHYTAGHKRQQFTMDYRNSDPA